MHTLELGALGVRMVKMVGVVKTAQCHCNKMTGRRIINRKQPSALIIFTLTPVVKLYRMSELATSVFGSSLKPCGIFEQ